MRTLLKLVVNLVMIALLLLVVGGWYYSTQLLPAVSDDPEPRTIEVVDSGEDTLTLRPTDEAPDWAVDDLRADEVVGFDGAEGYVRLSGPPVGIDGDEVERTGELVTGGWPGAGERGSMDSYAWPDDPTTTGLPVTEVTAPGPLGDLPGWEFTGTGEAADDWVVYVHGRGGSPTTALRTVGTVVGDLGHSALSITYRNDNEAMESPDGFGHYGDSEWEDLQAWLDWLTANREVETVTLYGYSQGGSVVAACLRRCTGTEVVTRTVLDSPLLSIQATLELQAAERGIPEPVIGPLLVSTKFISELRGGPDFDNLEHVDALAELDMPILAWHGDDDHTVPDEPTGQLGLEDPDQVTVLTYAGGHIRGWNVDPTAYEAELTAFLGG
jgi:uncharacterized protein